jgi:hypothetical protein
VYESNARILRYGGLSGDTGNILEMPENCQNDASTGFELETSVLVIRGIRTAESYYKRRQNDRKNRS